MQHFILCWSCERLISGTQKCKAFPDGIPEEIWSMEFDHHESYPGDNDIQFKNVKEPQNVSK